MNRNFTIVKKEMKENYFPALKLTGVSGIIMPADKIFSSNIAFAKKYDFSVWVTDKTTQTYNATYIDYDAMGVAYNSSNLKSFSVETLKNIIKSLSKEDIAGIDGFILKYPEVFGIIWDESFKEKYYDEFSNYIEDYLVALFEPSDSNESFRSWYYHCCENFIFDNYVKPALKWAKSKKLSLCFDIGDEASQYFYMKRHISVIDLLERGISLCVSHNTSGISEMSVIFSMYSQPSFVVCDDYDNRLDGLDINIIGHGSTATNTDIKGKERILLIRCDRGVAEKYVKFDDNVYFSNECESLSASLESTYYCDMLYEKGFDFEVTNEKFFEKHTKYKGKILTFNNREISQILLCKSCVFSEKMYNLLNKLKNDGICINNSNLINILSSELLQGEE